MDYTTFINKKTSQKSVAEVLAKTDKNFDGKYDKGELKDGIKDSVSIFAKPLAGKGADAALKAADTNKDGAISTEEADAYLKKNYGISLADAKKMNVKDLANYIQDYNGKKKKQE